MSIVLANSSEMQFTCCVCQIVGNASLFHQRIGWMNDRFIVCKECAATGKHCSRCERYMDFSHFNKSTGNTNRGGVSPYCIECRAIMRREDYDPERQRTYNLYAKYRMTPDDYDAMLQQQGGVCAACHQPETYLNKKRTGTKPLAIDHDHATGAMRGLLCDRCNRLLGQLERDRQWLDSFLKYLEKHSS